jgi:DNA helicase-2/ATP-dependent DNA helicase PcrA
MTRAMKKLYLSHARRRRVYGTYQFNPPSRFLAEIPADLLDDPVAAPVSSKVAGTGHNLASLADLVAAPDVIDNSFPVAEEVKPLRQQPQEHKVAATQGGFQLGSRVRHIKFGIGTIRRLEGCGDKQKVTVYFNSVGTKKLLLKFAGLMPG